MANNFMELNSLNSTDQEREGLGYEEFDPVLSGKYDEDNCPKYEICPNCRHFYAEKLVLCVGTSAILCNHCKGFDGNFEALGPSDKLKLHGMEF